MHLLFVVILIGVYLSGCTSNTAATAPRQPVFEQTLMPNIVLFQVNNSMPKRGDTVSVDWDVHNTNEVRIEIYDLDYYPLHYSLPPDQVLENLPPQGNLDLTIPANDDGTGWQIHLRTDANGTGDVKRIDLVFADVEQPVMLDIADFSISSETARREDTLTIHWDAQTTTRVSRDGVARFDEPLAGYEDKLFLEIFAGYTTGYVVSPPYQKIDSLPLKGSIEFVIPDYPPEFVRLTINLGLALDDQNMIYDIRSVELGT